MKKAAGILFVSLNGNALFLKRGPGAPDCAGCWDFPGGGREDEETPAETARREAREEIGFVPEGEMVPHVRTSSVPPGAVGVGAPSSILPVSNGAPIASMPEAVDFTTFLQKVTNEFTPELDDEHEGFAWAPIGSPPEPLHPGCRIALDRLSMDELGVARAMAEGRLASPERYENVTLFAIRITGTDTAFRSKHGEYVYRRPEQYLTDEFLARCNGLPVVFKHPAKAILDSKEFGNRVVGTIFLPYIAGTEVWGIAKIYDDDAIRLMEKGDLSTSPGVNFKDFTVNAKLTLEDGSKVLIEGKPSLFDHVAICELGVWDKGGEPSGIRSEAREDSAMTPEEQAKKDADEAAAKAKVDAETEEKRKADAAKKDGEESEEDKKKKADAAKADADAGSALDKKLSAMTDTVGKLADSVGAITKRMDAADQSRKDAEESEKRKAGDPEQLKADKAKKDAEDEVDKKKKADAEAEEKEKAKADSADVRKRIDAVAAMIPKSIGDADYSAVTDAQARADAVFSVFGQGAPRPLQGETAGLYERRCARLLKEHSPTWKKIDVDGQAFADDQAFGIVRDQIYTEAKATGLSPTTVEPGRMRMITRRSGGHEIHEFVGEPRSWMDPMAGAARQFVTSIKTPTNH